MKKYIFLGAAMLLFMAACSNDENNNPKEQPTQAVQFSFTNEDFGADETLSRATGAVETKPRLSGRHTQRRNERHIQRWGFHSRWQFPKKYEPV